MIHPKDMVGEVFWEHYGGWVRTCTKEVASQYRYPHVTPRELIGEAYIAARRSAKFWMPTGKANFFTYSKKLIQGFLRICVWKQLGTARPLPSEKSVPDSGTKSIPLHADVL